MAKGRRKLICIDFISKCAYDLDSTSQSCIECASVREDKFKHVENTPHLINPSCI